MPELAVSSGTPSPSRATCIAAREQWKHLWAISDFLESVDYVAGVKAGLELVGHPAGPPRPPILPLPQRSERAADPRAVLRRCAGAGSVRPDDAPGAPSGCDGRGARRGRARPVVLDAAHLVQRRHDGRAAGLLPAHLDGLRELLLHEPRGLPRACARSCSCRRYTGADFGIVVLEQGGFTPMSGSNTMCAVAGAVAAGL